MKSTCAGAVCCIVVLSLSADALAQGRKIRTIERPAEAPASAAPLPTDGQCRAAAFEVARRYGPREIETVLHPEFPNRDSLIDAIRRADLRVTNVRLEIESIESTKLQPWQAPTPSDQRAAASVARTLSTPQLASPRTSPRLTPTRSGDEFSATNAPVREVASVSDCIADVRTRLVFEDSDTGLRTVLPTGRAEWRLRFAR